MDKRIIIKKATKQCGSTITTGTLTASPTPLYSSLTDAAQSPVTTGHGSLIIAIVVYHSGDYSLKNTGPYRDCGATGGFRLYSDRISTEALYSWDF